MSEATIPIKELMEKTEQWLLGQGYKKSTLGFYRATWNRFLSYSASPAYSRETAEQFLLQYFGVDVHAIDQTLDGRMRHARRHMNALDEIFRTGTVCRRKVYGVASIDDDCFDKFFSDYLSYCKMQNFSRSWMDNTIAALRLFLLAVHVHILDWALHLDEATPHIHERHVFDAVNQYGELCPQQDKALEELGFELPKPNEKKGKYNNRKMVFDEECRKLFISICQNHGLTIDVEPVYGGASYLEKQDFIIMNQKKRIEEKQAVLDGLVMKIEDVNAVIEEAVDLAYEKACEVVTKRVKEETVKHDVDVVKDYGELLQQQPKDKLSDKSKSVASKVVNAIVAKLEKASQALLGNIISALNEPKNKVKAKEQIKEQARVSIQAKLKEKQKQVMEYEKKQDWN